MNTKQYKKLNNVTALKKAHLKLKRWLHLYVRLRDIKYSDKLGYYFVCIACGKFIEVTLFSDKSIYNGRHLHSSHYFDSEQMESVRYNPDNIHLGCDRCNRHLHGNKENYLINLKNKIGEKGFEKLNFLAHTIKKHDVIELDKLADEYKLKAQLRSAELQIKI